MIGCGCDEDGPAAAPVDPGVASSLFCVDKGSIKASAVDIALFGDPAGLVSSPAISDEPAIAAKSEVIGVVEGIETSLSRPCEPAPAPSLFEWSSSFISTGMDDCDVDDMLVPEPRPVDCVEDAIGRVFLGEWSRYCSGATLKRPGEGAKRVEW